MQPPEFVAVRESISDVVARPLLPGTNTLILRGGIGVPWEGVPAAEFDWKAVERGKAVLKLRDELVPSVANNGQWRPKHQRVQQQFIQGRSWKLSLLSCTTALRAVPLDCADNADEVWAFQTRGQALDVLEDREFLIGVPSGLLASLKGKGSPPEERGEFLRLVSGVPWDGVIYRFGAAG